VAPRGRRVVFRPLTPARGRDLVALFGPTGACAGCWCMWPRLRHADFQRGRGAANRRAFRRRVAAGPPPGVLAYVDGAPAGWCALAPRAEYPRLESSRVLAPADARPVWSVVCFFVARPHRGRGLSVALLEAAVAFAAGRGARIVEGYPVEPRARTADAFVWTGLAATFRAAGFHEVARRSATRPIMRRSVRWRRAGREGTAQPPKRRRASASFSAIGAGRRAPNRA
jgi:GNAT superfamily N-acetyltransferase